MEVNQLIANRIPPGDKWRLLDEGDRGQIYESITEALEGWYLLNNSPKVDFRLSPLKGELSAIHEEADIIEEPVIKKFNIYGEEN